MRDPEFIDFKALKEAIKALNTCAKLEPAIKTIGIKKATMVTQFAENVEKAANDGVEIPAEVILFYNENCADDAKNPEGAAAAKVTKKKDPPAPLSFDSISKRLATPTNPTSHLDAALLAGGTLANICANLLPITDAAKTKAFTPASVKAHIAFRKKKGWVYDVSGEGDATTYRFVGYVNPKSAAPADATPAE